MRYYLLLVAPCIMLCFFALDCKAQNTKADTTFHPHWEIGLDLLPLIDKENAPKNSLFARRNYFEKYGKGRAWRVRAGMEVEKRNYSNVAYWTPDNYNSYSPYLSFGHEWQYSIGKRFRWFVGVDGQCSYIRRNDFYISTFVLTDSLREKIVVNEWKFGLNGVIGFKLNITSALSISSEAIVSANYWHYHYKNDAYYKGILAEGILSEDFDKIFRFQFYPIYVINLTYTIKTIRHENKKT